MGFRNKHNSGGPTLMKTTTIPLDNLQASAWSILGLCRPNIAVKKLLQSRATTTKTIVLLTGIKMRIQMNPDLDCVQVE